MVFCILPPQRLIIKVGEEEHLLGGHFIQECPRALQFAAIASVLEGLVCRAVFLLALFSVFLSANKSCY